MKTLKIAGAVIGVLILAILGFLFYLGAFATVPLEKTVFQSVEVIAFQHRGAYQNIGKSWEAFEKAWLANGLNECDGLAVYLDPPDTPEEKLRSVLGCNISSLPERQKASLRGKFQHFVLPQMEAMTSRFPFKNVLSFMIGPMKVYPKLSRAVEEQGGKPSIAIELYSSVKKIQEIRFVMPLAADRAVIAGLVWKD